MRRTALLLRSLWRFHRRAVLVSLALLLGAAGLTAYVAAPSPSDGEPDRLRSNLNALA